MDIITILTVSSTIALWTNTILLCGLIASGSIVAIAILDKARQLFYDAGLNLITLYSGWMDAKLTIQSRHSWLVIETEQARLMIREQRQKLLSGLE